MGDKCSKKERFEPLFDSSQRLLHRAQTVWGLRWCTCCESFHGLDVQAWLTTRWSELTTASWCNLCFSIFVLPLCGTNSEGGPTWTAVAVVGIGKSYDVECVDVNASICVSILIILVQSSNPCSCDRADVGSKLTGTLVFAPLTTQVSHSDGSG